MGKYQLTWAGAELLKRSAWARSLSCSKDRLQTEIVFSSRLGAGAEKNQLEIWSWSWKKIGYRIGAELGKADWSEASLVFNSWTASFQMKFKAKFLGLYLIPLNIEDLNFATRAVQKPHWQKNMFNPSTSMLCLQVYLYL